MSIWIQKHFDNIEHVKTTVSAIAIVAAAISLLMVLTWAFFSH